MYHTSPRKIEINTISDCGVGNMSKFHSITDIEFYISSFPLHDVNLYQPFYAKGVASSLLEYLRAHDWTYGDCAEEILENLSEDEFWSWFADYEL